MTQVGLDVIIGDDTLLTRALIVDRVNNFLQYDSKIASDLGSELVNIMFDELEDFVWLY